MASTQMGKMLCQMHSPEKWEHELNKILVAFVNA